MQCKIYLYKCTIGPRSLESFRNFFTLDRPTSKTPLFARALASCSAAAKICLRLCFARTIFRSSHIMRDVYLGWGGLPPASTPKPEKLPPGYHAVGGIAAASCPKCKNNTHWPIKRENRNQSIPLLSRTWGAVSNAARCGRLRLIKNSWLEYLADISTEIPWSATSQSAWGSQQLVGEQGYFFNFNNGGAEITFIFQLI